ncbi:MAG: hypothetical protein C4341_01240 [Armatimonadota bacterium]
MNRGGSVHGPVREFLPEKPKREYAQGRRPQEAAAGHTILSAGLGIGFVVLQHRRYKEESHK